MSSSGLAIQRLQLQKDLLRSLQAQKASLELVHSRAAAAFETARRELDDATVDLQHVDKLCQELSSTISTAQNSIFARSISSLPAEMLRAIFEAFCEGGEWPMSYDVDNDANIERASAPEVLSGVCKAWRRVALDSPTIWSYILMQFGPSADTNSGLVRRLQRSKNAALDIMLLWHRDTAVTAEHRQALCLLSEQHFRWRKFRFDGLTSGEDHRSFLDIFRLPTPLLEILYVQFNFAAIAESGGSVSYLPDRRRLRYFQSGACDLLWSSRQNTPSVITHLCITISAIQLSIVWAALEDAASTLAHLELVNLAHGRVFHGHFHPIQFPALRSLVGAGGSEEIFRVLTGCIVAPNLASFSFSNGDLAICEDFLAETCRHIVTLDLEDTIMEAPTAHVLRSLRHVRKLVFDARDSEPAFRAAVMQMLDGDEKHAAGWLFPVLETIELRWVAKAEEIRSLVDIVRNRRVASRENKSSAPARITAVHFKEFCKVDALDRLLISREIEGVDA